MSYPPQYGYPQQHGYPQQQPAYPQQPAFPGQPQYGQRPPVAPFGHVAQPQRPVYAPPPPPPRKKPNKVVYFVSLALCLGIGGVAAFSAISASEPKVGDCLASMDNRFFGGLEIVKCEDAKANYEVVNKQTGNGNPSVCLDHPGGESFREGGKRGKIHWEICAMPK